jgi:hypothetical protein
LRRQKDNDMIYDISDLQISPDPLPDPPQPPPDDEDP